MKECLRTGSAIWARAVKKFASFVVGRQSLKSIGLKGRQIISLPEAPTYLGLPLRDALSAVISVRKWSCQESLNLKKVSLPTVIQDV